MHEHWCPARKGGECGCKLSKPSGIQVLVEGLMNIRHPKQVSIINDVKAGSSVIPDRMAIGPNQWVPVIQRPLEPPRKGYWDPKAGEIVIGSEQSEVAKLIVLFHEVMHINEQRLKQQGIIKRRPNHDYVTYMAPCLVGTLGLSGLLSIDPKEVLEFFMAEEEE